MTHFVNSFKEILPSLEGSDDNRSSDDKFFISKPGIQYIDNMRTGM